MPYKRHKLPKAKTQYRKESKVILYDEYNGFWVVGFTNNRPLFSLAKWKAVRFNSRDEAEEIISNGTPMFFDWAEIRKVRRWKMNEIYKLIPLKEAATDLAMSDKTLYRKVQQNLIPYHRIGRAIRFKRSDLKIWLDNNCPDLPTMKRKGLF